MIRAILALFGLSFFTISAQAALLQFSWSGFLETSSPFNYWGLQGDGSALTTTDGTPFELSLTVDTAAVDLVYTSGDTASYFVSSGSLTLGGVAAVVNPTNTQLRFSDDMFSGQFDSISGLVYATFNGTSLSFSTGLRLARNTFDLADVASVDPLPLVASTVAIQQTAGSSGSLTSVELLGTALTVTPVPVPAAAWLFGSALIGLVGIKRKM